jgi:ferrous iron transport protein B
MSTVYNVGEGSGDDTGIQALADTLKAQRHPDGRPVYTLATTLALMVFYVFALQCVSTVAIVRRETAHWFWPVFQWAYMAVLAWLGAFLTYHLVQILTRA